MKKLTSAHPAPPERNDTTSDSFAVSCLLTPHCLLVVFASSLERRPLVVPSTSRHAASPQKLVCPPGSKHQKRPTKNLSASGKSSSNIGYHHIVLGWCLWDEGSGYSPYIHAGQTPVPESSMPIIKNQFSHSAWEAERPECHNSPSRYQTDSKCSSGSSSEA